MANVDMIAWDFGDTLVDEQIMRVPPPDVPGWTDAINELWESGGWVDRWSLGEVSMNELVVPLAMRTSMRPSDVARYLRATWRAPRLLQPAARWLRRLDGVVTQVIVTVNPHEFHGVAASTGLDQLVDLIVTSAEIRSVSKVDQTLAARRYLGLDGDLGSTVLVDNKEENVSEFRQSGGRAVLFAESDVALDDYLSQHFGSIGES